MHCTWMPGQSVHLQVFKKVGKTAVRLLLIPGICEALVSGTVAHFIFDMPLLLGFTLGFILKAVGPAIVIQLMFDLQRRGRGVDKGAGSTHCPCVTLHCTTHFHVVH